MGSEMCIRDSDGFSKQMLLVILSVVIIATFFILAARKQQLTDARAEANRIREEARAEGAQILADLKAKAAAESARITEQAHAAIESERQAAVVSLRSEVGTLATTLAGRIVGEALTDDERAARVVDRFLADLETQNAGAAK